MKMIRWSLAWMIDKEQGRCICTAPWSGQGKMRQILCGLSEFIRGVHHHLLGSGGCFLVMSRCTLRRPVDFMDFQAVGYLVLCYCFFNLPRDLLFLLFVRVCDYNRLVMDLQGLGAVLGIMFCCLVSYASENLPYSLVKKKN